MIDQRGRLLRSAVVCQPRCALRRLGLAAVFALLSVLIGTATPRFGSAAPIEVINKSSLTTAQGAEFTAAIRDGRFGPELVVSGFVGDRTTTGERLVKAELEIAVAQADGGQLWAGVWSATPGGDFDWRVAVKPFGVLDGALIAQVTLRDREVTTVESRERMEDEARRREEAAQAEFRRQQEAAQAELNRQAGIARAEEAARVRAARAAEAQREAQREAKIRAYGWPKDIESAVIGRAVMPGMTTEQVTLAWGTPRHVNETIHALGRSEQWSIRVFRERTSDRDPDQSVAHARPTGPTLGGGDRIRRLLDALLWPRALGAAEAGVPRSTRARARVTIPVVSWTVLLGNNRIIDCDAALVVEDVEVFRLREHDRDGNLVVDFDVRAADGTLIAKIARNYVAHVADGYEYRNQKPVAEVIETETGLVVARVAQQGSDTVAITGTFHVNGYPVLIVPDRLVADGVELSGSEIRGYGKAVVLRRGFIGIGVVHF
jgi:hypothetical protein